jgi:hypothetical protein
MPFPKSNRLFGKIVAPLRAAREPASGTQEPASSLLRFLVGAARDAFRGIAAASA